MGVSFPLKASSNGRYLVDQNGVPFRVQGDASWDYTNNLSQTDLEAYIDQRALLGDTALLIYANPIAYYVGSNAPWVLHLGGSGAGTAALPFSKNISGGTWDGDPTFTNHDAAFSFPVDAYWEWLGIVADYAATKNIVCFFFFCYLGFNAGAADGWWQTLTNAGNTQAVCNTFGAYLANGHGTFGGFLTRKNIVWVCGGDYLPPNGSEGALRMKKILQGMQSAGDTKLVTAHWQHDYLTLDQTDVSSLITVYHSYTHGVYPTPGPTYPEGRATYSQSPTAPSFLIETNYWGEHGASRAQIRYYQWGSSISCVGGCFLGFGPFWGFATSADGSSATSVSNITCWAKNTAYSPNIYASNNGNWYRCTVAGTSANAGTGPSGTGSSIVDNTVTWTFVATISVSMGGMDNLLTQPAILDFQVLVNTFNPIAWWELVPSGLASTGTIITAGQGTVATWSDGNSPSNNMDWIVSSAAADKSAILIYVPDAHVGTFTVDCTRVGTAAIGMWIDPSSPTAPRQSIGSVSNAGTRVFTVPGTNAAGDSDWVLLIKTNATDPIGFAADI
jgi:hypothetical protein